MEKVIDSKHASNRKHTLHGSFSVKRQALKEEEEEKKYTNKYWQEGGTTGGKRKFPMARRN